MADGRRRILSLALALATALAASPAVAQTQPAPREASATAVKPPRVKEAEARAQRLQELAAVMGASHYLRILCGGRGEQRWRLQMQKLLEIEGKGFARAPLVEAFNAGFRGEEERFPECSPAVEKAEQDLMAQGRRLTDSLAAPYRAQ